MLNMNLYQGRLVRDIELKDVGSNKLANFTLAVERSFKNAQGEKETDFINCTAWRQTAENLAKYVHKGDGIIVTGRTQVRNYENKEGQKVYVTEIVVDQFDFPLQNKRQDNAAPKNETPYQNKESVDILDSDFPF